MTNLRIELQQQAGREAVSHALFRPEGALALALGMVLAAVLPLFVPEVPWWVWLLLGGLGWGAIFYVSLTDPQSRSVVLGNMLAERLKLRALKDNTLRQRIAGMIEYVRQAERDVQRERAGTLQTQLEALVGRFYDWVAHSYQLARYLDTYRRDHRLELRRQELPKQIDSLVARRKYERNPDVQQRLDESMEALGRDWETLSLLDAQMQQAEAELEQNLTALAQAYSAVHLLVEQRGLDLAHLARLEEEVGGHVEQLTDVVNQIDNLYTDALDEG